MHGYGHGEYSGPFAYTELLLSSYGYYVLVFNQLCSLHSIESPDVPQLGSMTLIPE